MPGVLADINSRMARTDRAVHYREQAERFRELARTETQPSARNQLLEMAVKYRKLADDLASPKRGA